MRTWFIGHLIVAGLSGCSGPAPTGQPKPVEGNRIPPAAQQELPKAS